MGQSVRALGRAAGGAPDVRLPASAILAGIGWGPVGDGAAAHRRAGARVALWLGLGPRLDRARPGHGQRSPPRGGYPVGGARCGGPGGGHGHASGRRVARRACGSGVSRACGGGGWSRRPRHRACELRGARRGGGSCGGGARRAARDAGADAGVACRGALRRLAACAPDAGCGCGARRCRWGALRSPRRVGVGPGALGAARESRQARPGRLRRE